MRGFFVAERVPALGESVVQHGALVEAALRRITNTIRKKWNVIRVALVVRLGTIENGALSLIVAVSASRWRDALDAAQHASLEIKDKLTASIAPLCLGKEPKAAAALAAVAAAAGTTTANILGQTIGDLAVEAIVEAVTRGDRDKVLATAAQREEEQATAAAKRNEKGADAAATKEEAPEASVEPEGAATPAREKRRRRECARGSFERGARANPRMRERRKPRGHRAPPSSRYASKSDDDATA